MARAIDPNATRVKILTADKKLDLKEQTRWNLRNLRVYEYTYLMEPYRAGQMIPNALHLGLTGVENFLDANGAPVVLVRDMNAAPIIGDIRPWSEESLSRIHPADRDEIASEIVKHEKVSQEVAKNS